MDTFELAKIAGAVLSALLVIVGFRTMLEIVEESRRQEKPGFTLPLPAEQTPAAQPGAGAAVPAPVALPAFDPAAVVKASADGNAQNGATTFKKCQACHDRDRRAAPTKWAPTCGASSGARRRAHEGFNYSDALKAKGGNWTPEDLVSFVHGPKTFAPGTKMLFPGIPDATDLADLLAYLNTLK